MAIRRALVLGFLFVLVVVAVAACGSDDAKQGAGSATTTGTELKVTGESAKPLSGTLSCSGATSKGTGMFADNAVEICQKITDAPAVFSEVGATNRMCAQMYGGPEHAKIQGTVEGARVDVTVNRSDGCGIDDWQKIEWLLGPPAA
jgi:hypothetical protein